MFTCSVRPKGATSDQPRHTCGRGSFPYLTPEYLAMFTPTERGRTRDWGPAMYAFHDLNNTVFLIGMVFAEVSARSKSPNIGP